MNDKIPIDSSNLRVTIRNRVLSGSNSEEELVMIHVNSNVSVTWREGETIELYHSNSLEALDARLYLTSTEPTNSGGARCVMIREQPKHGYSLPINRLWSLIGVADALRRGIHLKKINPKHRVNSPISHDD